MQKINNYQLAISNERRAKPGASRKVCKQQSLLIIHCSLIISLFFLLSSCATTQSVPDELDMTLREVSDYLNESVPHGNKIAFVSVQSDSAALTEYVIDTLAANAVNDKIFSVVDRQQLDAARAELNFNWSGEVSDQSAQSVGKMLGAQTIVVGKITAIGDHYRLNIRALETETVKMQGSNNWNIAAGKTITALMKSTSSGGRTGSTYSANGASSGASSNSTSTVKATAPTAPAKLANGTYTFWPRPRATKAGVGVDAYIDRIVVTGKYMVIYMSNVSRGMEGRAFPYYWYLNAILTDLDNPRKTWKMIDHKDGPDGPNTGESLSFENVTARRFSLETDWNGQTIFDEIIIPDQPDE